jgi:hypothetical protein
MLKEAAAGGAYSLDDGAQNAMLDVNLTSKDMEVNFSNKQEEEDELDQKINPSDFP